MQSACYARLLQWRLNVGIRNNYYISGCLEEIFRNLRATFFLMAFFQCRKFCNVGLVFWKIILSDFSHLSGLKYAVRY